MKKIILKLEDYISYNNIADKNKYLVFNCSLKDEAILWQEIIGEFLVRDDWNNFETVLKHRKAFMSV